MMTETVSVTGFNGEYQDCVLHQYILGNGYRAYNPPLQRFTSPDSMSPFGAGGINPYSYCAGDPINNTDPSGHFMLGIFGLIGMGVITEIAGIGEVADFALGAGIAATAGNATADIVTDGAIIATEGMTTDAVFSGGATARTGTSPLLVEDSSFRQEYWAENGPAASIPDVSSKTAQESILSIMNDSHTQKFIDNPNGQCFNCAEFINSKLKGPRRTIGLSIWNGPSDLYPENHFVILSYDNPITVLDPTMAQFQGCEPFFGSWSEWERSLKNAIPGKLIKAKEYTTPYEANTEFQSLIKSSLLDFNGNTLQEPSWYKKIEKNMRLYKDFLKKLN